MCCKYTRKVRIENEIMRLKSKLTGLVPFAPGTDYNMDLIERLVDACECIITVLVDTVYDEEERVRKETNK